MQKGFARPLLIVAVLLLLAVPFSMLVKNGNLPFSQSDNVKGAQTVSNSRKPGFDLTITSSEGTWELIKYLCTTEDECSSSLESGTRYGSIGGGKTSLQTVYVASDQGWVWKNYKFLKVFVRPGISSPARDFKVSSLGGTPGSIKKSFDSGDVVIYPLESIMNEFSVSASFTDAE